MTHIHIRRPLDTETLQQVKDHVIRLWTDEGLDTVEISKIVGFAEHWCHRIIRQWRENQIKNGAAS